MSTRAYGQYCGFARALELVGERWGLMIVRDLFTGPKRFSDLQRGLQKIPSNILATRLKELEENGVLERITQREPRGVVYRLTDDGLALETAVIALGRWGAKRLGEMREGEVITPDSMMMALRTTFRSELAEGPRVAYELHFGSIILHAVVDHAQLTVGEGAMQKPDLAIHATPAFRAVMAGEIRPREAIERGIVRIEGSYKLFERFTKIFRI